MSSSSQVEALASRLENLGIQGFKPYSGANPTQNPVDIFRSYITEQLAKISGVDESLIFPALEFTSNSDRGDLIIPVPRLRVKGGKPAELAEKWAAEFPKSDYLESVVANGVFVQFTYKPKILFDIVLRDVLKKKTDFGASKVGTGKNIVVEFSSPNIAKPFHAGHLRSTIIGGFMSNLFEKHSFNVTRINYLGDWGKQFGVLAVAYSRFGDKDLLESDPVNHLFNIYVKINKVIEEEKASNEEGLSETDEEARAHFRKLEDGDEEALALWSKLRDLSIEKYKETYARLNIHYDVYSGESQVPKDRMESAKQTLLDKGLITEDRGALLVDLRPYKKSLGKTLVQKSDGTSLYLTRDIGEIAKRWDQFHFDKHYYVVATQQDLHFAQLMKITELMGYEWADRIEHINYGMVQGMSTRKGTVVFLDTILEETKDAMHEVMKKNEKKYAQVENPEKVADLVGLAAIVVQDMQSKRVNNYTFDWKRMLSFEGDTGPYLQYAHARLCSMERTSGLTREQLEQANFELLTEPIAAQVAKAIASWPDVLLMALKNLEPSTIITYLFRLTHLVSSCYDILWVAGQEPELATARMALYASARQVLYNGMVLVGLTPVERM